MAYLELSHFWLHMNIKIGPLLGPAGLVEMLGVGWGAKSSPGNPELHLELRRPSREDPQVDVVGGLELGGGHAVRVLEQRERERERERESPTKLLE